MLKHLALIILFVSSNLFSQVYYFKKYTTADGLVQGTVREIYQDSKGRMWFGTVDGLSIFDGSEFYNYKEENGLKVPIISGFLELGNNVMLVGTSGNGIEVFVKHPYQKDSIAYTIKDKKFLIDPRVNQIKRDREGNIWICTEKGITKWIFKNGSFNEIIHENNFDGLGEIEVYAVAFGNNSEVYFATSKGLIKYFNNKYQVIFHKSNKEYEPIFYLYYDKQNTLWFSSLKKLYYLKDGKVEGFKVSDGSGDFAVNAIIENNLNELIIGSLGRLIILNKSGTKIIDQNNGFTEKAVLSFFIDREENLWIGSLEGFSKLSKSNFRFVEKNSIELNFPHIFKTNNELYLGNGNGIYPIIDFKLVKAARFREFESTRVLDYLKDGKSEWFATDNGVIHLHAGKNNYYNESNGLPNNFVYSITKDSSGIVWILTQGGAAYVKNGVLFNFKNRLEKKWKYSDDKCQSILSSTSIRQLVIDEYNTKWIATWRDRLLRVSNDSIYCYTEKDGLMDLRVRGLYLDSKKQLWIGTRFNGVYRFNGKVFSNFSTKDGLSSNWIFSITEDGEGNYWFSTSKGLSKFDGKNWLKFDASDGIIGGEILTSCLFNNILWFNSWNQVFCYLPDNKSGEAVRPKVYFTQVRLLDSELPLNNKIDLDQNFHLNDLLKKFSNNESIEIDYGNNTVFFDFAGTSYKGERQITYDYMLEGFDKNWVKTSRRNFVTYTHLPPGEYKFNVYAVNREGLKSESPAAFSFRILPPFWLRWWFIISLIILFVITISSITLLLYRIRVKNLLRIERIRGDIASDLHDAVGSGLSGISIFSQLAKRELKSDNPKVSGLIDKIEKDSRELIEKMSDIVWAINPENDTLEEALIKFQEYSLSLLEAKGINVQMNIPENSASINLSLENRRNLLYIFKEVINNVAKHSNASNVIIKMVIEENAEGFKKILKLLVEDNGKGFDTTKYLKGNGLNNIKKRTEGWGGKVEISSVIGQGSKYTLIFPVD